MSAKKKYEYQGQMYTNEELAKLSGLKLVTVQSRLNSGWSVERIMSTPRLSLAQAGQRGAKAMRSGLVSLTRG
jgi:hypothetical protein